MRRVRRRLTVHVEQMQTAATAGTCPQQFECLACKGQLELSQLGGGTLKCPHCDAYMLESIQAATTAALEAAAGKGEHIDLTSLTDDFELITDQSLPQQQNETLKGFTPAQLRDPFPPNFLTNLGFSGASGSQSWAKSGSVPDTSQAFQPQPPKASSPSRELRQAAAPY